MPKIYEFDAAGYATGVSKEIDDYDGAPSGWTRQQPPETGPGEFAIWQAGRWSVTTSPKQTGRSSANAEILAKITAMEAKQPRAVREALLGIDGAIERLQAIEDQIADLRAQIV